MENRPVIGITVDSDEGGGRPAAYVLRRNYADAVSAAGGVPLLLPHEVDAVERVLGLIDGLVVTGGDFDVDPALFGAAGRHPTVKTKDRRTTFEAAAIRAALARDLPVLGICGGQQLLNVVLGGTLVQHIADAVPGALEHEQKNPRTEPGHTVAVVLGTMLRGIVDRAELSVNSAHHQAAGETGPGVVVNARAPDGVIEGIEHPGHRFCLGVEWHPEYAISAGDPKIFAAFVTAAARG